MKINIYIIDKKAKREMYEPLIEHYSKLCRQWADVEVHEIFSRDIVKAQEQTPQLAQRAYTQAFERFRAKGYNIVLDPKGDSVDSYQFSKLLEDSANINFFIGGAYGLERSFVETSNKSISFGRITLSHKLIKVVLMEQIFRGLSILNNHPYHK